MTVSVRPVDRAADAHAETLAWLARIRTGDDAAFEMLFRRYAGPLYDFAHGYVESRDAAEEIVQELFVRLWERRHQWEVRGSVATYLYRATRNGALNAVRDRRRGIAFRAALADEPRREVAGIEQEMAAEELAVMVARVVARLPDRCREVFRLNRYHHLTYAEVAQVLDLSVKTVEIHMARALRELRERLNAWRP